jgi:hypothetical protein
MSAMTTTSCTNRNEHYSKKATKTTHVIKSSVMAFLNKLKDNSDKNIVGWDANELHDIDTVMDLLQETEMIDAFLDFFSDPSCHSQLRILTNRPDFNLLDTPQVC